MRDTQIMILKQIKDEQFKLQKEIRSWLGPLILFSLIMIAFPLSIDLMNIGLAELFLNIIIITILVTNYLSIDDVFFEDFYDGTIEQSLIKDSNLYAYVACKLIITVIMKILPLTLMSIVFAIAYKVNVSFLPDLCLLFINMQIIFVNMLFFGNAISINKGSTLGLILVMPIIFPAVILFGQALTFLRLEIPIFSIHFMATGISIIACILLTFVTAITLKLHLE